MMPEGSLFLLPIIFQHTISDTKLVDDIALFAGRHAHLLPDVLENAPA